MEFLHYIIGKFSLFNTVYDFYWVLFNCFLQIESLYVETNQKYSLYYALLPKMLETNFLINSKKTIT